jgi:hypothetical protein
VDIRKFSQRYGMRHLGQQKSPSELIADIEIAQIIRYTKCKGGLP